MGSFGGHILPGTCFLIFATWLPFQLMLSTFHRHKHEHAYKRTDSVIIMCLVSSGIFVELFWPWNNNHPPYGHLYRPGTNEFWMPMNWQHFTMYLFFGFFGLARYVQTLQGSLFKGDKEFILLLHVIMMIRSTELLNAYGRIKRAL